MDPIRLIIAPAHTRRLAIDCDGYCSLIDAGMNALMCGGGVVSSPCPCASMALFARRADTAHGSPNSQQAAPKDGLRLGRNGGSVQHSPKPTQKKHRTQSPYSCYQERRENTGYCFGHTGQLGIVESEIDRQIRY